MSWGDLLNHWQAITGTLAVLGGGVAWLLRRRATDEQSRASARLAHAQASQTEVSSLANMLDSVLPQLAELQRQSLETSRLLSQAQDRVRQLETDLHRLAKAISDHLDEMRRDYPDVADRDSVRRIRRQLSDIQADTA